MSGSQCEKCGHALALADRQCAGCGTMVPAAQRLALMLPRAEALAEGERFAEAARALEAALALELEAVQAKNLWRKRGVWLRKASAREPQHLDGAEEALTKALHLDDADDLSHQIWIDLLVQRGLADKARAWYQQRLQADPEDAVAKRQMAVLRLAADFKFQPVPKSQLDDAPEPKGYLWKIIVPTRWKIWMVGVGGVFSLFVALYSSGRPPYQPQPALQLDPELAAAASAGIDPAQLMAMATDPGLNLFAGLASAAYVFWGYSRKQRKRG